MSLDKLSSSKILKTLLLVLFAASTLFIGGVKAEAASTSWSYTYNIYGNCFRNGRLIRNCNKSVILQTNTGATFFASSNKDAYSPGEIGTISIAAQFGVGTGSATPEVSVYAFFPTQIAGCTGSSSCSATGYFTAPTVPGTYTIALLGYMFANQAPSSLTFTVANSCVANQNAACTSAANACGQTNQGTVQCNGSCSATPPSNATCPPVVHIFPPVPSTINQGQSSNLSWASSGAVSCTSTGGFSTNNRTSGNARVSPLTTTSYQIYCDSSSGTRGYSNIVTVTVRVPTAVVSVTPTRVRSGGTVTVSWNATNVNSCDITRNGSPWKQNLAGANLTNSAQDTITSQTTYVMTCTGAAASASVSSVPVTVNIAPTYNEF